MLYFVASDHAGFELKVYIKAYLEGAGHRVVDLGPTQKDRVDYPDYAHALCQKILGHPGSHGVLVCGTGIGMSISANRHPGIRAALCHDAYTATMTRAHNDANVLCLGARVVGIGVVDSILRSFLETSFEGGQHACRLSKVEGGGSGYTHDD